MAAKTTPGRFQVTASLLSLWGRVWQASLGDQIFWDKILTTDKGLGKPDEERDCAYILQGTT